MLYFSVNKKSGKTQQQRNNEVISWPKINEKTTGKTITKDTWIPVKKNFECENKDEHLGCDMGIDVAG
jgi:hypothetical protein